MQPGNDCSKGTTGLLTKVDYAANSNQVVKPAADKQQLCDTPRKYRETTEGYNVMTIPPKWMATTVHWQD
jgi:hypothetical protein